MDRKKRSGITTVALSAMVLAASPAHAVSRTLGMSAVILASVLALFEITSLDFGSLLEAGAGTVTIDAKDTHTVSANITELAAGHAGKMGVTAFNGVPFTLDYPNPGAFEVLTDGVGNTMTVDTIVMGRTTVTGVASSLVTSLTGTTPTANGTFGVGGTLTISAGQTPGTYTGSVTITVAY